MDFAWVADDLVVLVDHLDVLHDEDLDALLRSIAERNVAPPGVRILVYNVGGRLNGRLAVSGAAGARREPPGLWGARRLRAALQPPVGEGAGSSLTFTSTGTAWQPVASSLTPMSLTFEDR
jgi:hypothetical protein